MWRALSPLAQGKHLLKPPIAGGWPSLRVGVANCHESEEIFPGSQVDFGAKIGMQEQAAATLADMAYSDVRMQEIIIGYGSLPLLLSLVRSGSPTAQEYATRALWYLSMQLHNQKVFLSLEQVMPTHGFESLLPEIACGLLPPTQHAAIAFGWSLTVCRAAISLAQPAIPDFVATLKNGSPLAQMLAAATLSELAQGYIYQTFGAETAFGDAAAADKYQGETVTPANPSEPDSDRLRAIADAQGILPLIKLCTNGTEEAKEKAASMLWHLALDENSRDFIGAQGGINPLAAVLAGGTKEAIDNANYALARLGQASPLPLFILAWSPLSGSSLDPPS